MQRFVTILVQQVVQKVVQTLSERRHNSMNKQRVLASCGPVERGTFRGRGRARFHGVTGREAGRAGL
jgi:hypothetical protein